MSWVQLGLAELRLNCVEPKLNCVEPVLNLTNYFSLSSIDAENLLNTVPRCPLTPLNAWDSKTRI